jgi:hypothetical protein
MKLIPLAPAALLAPLAAMAFAAPALAQSAESGIWTLQDENASIAVTGPTDRYYVNGFHVGWTSPAGAVPAPVAELGHDLLGAGTQRFSLGILQQLYTAADTSAIDPSPYQEPYAGYLVAQAGLTQDSGNTRTLLGVNLGVIGRDAGGEIVQNDFHAIIGQKGTHGWAYQLPSEPALDLTAARIWRLNTGTLFGLETDALPQVSGMAGLTEDYVQSALAMRIGQGLGSDFGVPMLTNSPTGGDAYSPVAPLDWYLFASIAGKLVAHDEVLQGADFQPSRHVDAFPAVGSFSAGVAVLWRGWRFTYTEVFQTTRYYDQPQTLHEFGSFSVSAAF